MSSVTVSSVCLRSAVPLTTKSTRFSQGKVWVAGAILMVSIEPKSLPPDVRGDGLKALTAEPTAPPIALVTTHWDKASDRNAGSKMEAALQKATYTSDSRNTLVFRYSNDGDSAWKAVDAVVSKFVLGIEGAERPRPMKPISGLRGSSAGIFARLLQFIATLLHRQKR